MADEDGKAFHYGDPVINAGRDGHFVGVVVAAFRDRSSANGVTWSKTTVASNKHSRRLNCFAGEHLLRIDGPRSACNAVLTCAAQSLREGRR